MHLSIDSWTSHMGLHQVTFLSDNIDLVCLLVSLRIDCTLGLVIPGSLSCVVPLIRLSFKR